MAFQKSFSIERGPTYPNAYHRVMGPTNIYTEAHDGRNPGDGLVLVNVYADADAAAKTNGISAQAPVAQVQVPMSEAEMGAALLSTTPAAGSDSIYNRLKTAAYNHIAQAETTNIPGFNYSGALEV